MLGMVRWVEELVVSVFFGCSEEARFLGLVFCALGSLVYLMVDGLAGRIETIRTGSGFFSGGGT